MNKVLSFSADLKNLDRVERFVNSVLELEEINEKLSGNVLIAVTESFSNAVVHGSQNDPNKTVFIEYSNLGQDIAFKIIDQGKGFDYREIPDPTAEENLEKESGRGVYLISSLSDEVNFHNNGSTIEVKFSIAI